MSQNQAKPTTIKKSFVVLGPQNKTINVNYRCPPIWPKNEGWMSLTFCPLSVLPPVRLEESSAALCAQMERLEQEMEQERKKQRMLEIKLRNSERAREDAENRNRLLEKEMEDFFSTLGDLALGSRTSDIWYGEATRSSVARTVRVCIVMLGVLQGLMFLCGASGRFVRRVHKESGDICVHSEQTKRKNETWKWQGNCEGCKYQIWTDHVPATIGWFGPFPCMLEMRGQDKKTVLLWIHCLSPGFVL